MRLRELLESKSSKETAGYQPNPKNGQKCINCTMWRDPNKCTAVAGNIDPNGWCEWYAGGAYGKHGKQVSEDGRIVKGVNTTVDVGPNEIKTQAAKFGNSVTKDGVPPTLSKPVKGKSTNVAFNLGLTESEIEEGWKDWVAGAALGAAALSANAGNIAIQPVEKGDTVYSIARQNGVSPQEIMKLNGFNKDTKLKLGQEVKVPDNAKDAKPIAKTPVVKKAEPKAAPVTSNTHENLLIKIATAAGINGTELAAFLAQVAHESHDFQSMVEYGGSLDFRKYDPKYAPKKAKSLGNTKPGDGAKYKGRGYIQITGKYNYAKAGKALGLDLVTNPTLAEKPAVAAKIAVWYWKLRVQPNVDNFNDVKSVTKPINPAMRGLEDRKENFKDYKMMVASL
jgi:predicted chitinase